MTIEAGIFSRQRVGDDSPALAGMLCAHCGLPVPAGLIEPGAGEQFCCGGCRAVYETLRSCGLEDYYRLRDAADVQGKPVDANDSSFDSFDSPTFHELYVQWHGDGAASVDLILENVQCAACIWLLERLPRVLPGVIEARLSLRQATLRVTWNPQQAPLSRIARTLQTLGYTPHPARGMSASELHRREMRKRLVHLGAAGAVMGNTMLLSFALYAGDMGHMQAEYRLFFRILSASLGTIALAWPGAVFFRGAVAAIRTRTVNLDVPIAIALAVGGIAGLVNVVANRGEIYFDSLTVLVFLLLVGRFIQYRQQRRADDAVGLLFSLTPSTCRIVRGERIIESPVEALVVDDLVEVRPGEIFPADGVVTGGDSSVNQSLLTGESMPWAVGKDSDVHAGSQNVSSPLVVRVTKTGSQTRVGKLMHLVERGIQDKPPIVQFADRAGNWFLIAVTLAAAATFAWWCRSGMSLAIDHTVALLIVSCPCVLGLATPLTLALAIGQLATRDILVKSAAALETLSRGGNLFIDKTGTLTEGRMELIEWFGDESIKPLVAGLEQHSNHPVGRAIASALASDSQGDMVFHDVVERNDGGISGISEHRFVRIGSPRYIRAAGIAIPTEFVDVADRFESRRDGGGGRAVWRGASGRGAGRSASCRCGRCDWITAGARLESCDSLGRFASCCVVNCLAGRGRKRGWSTSTGREARPTASRGRWWRRGHGRRWRE